MEGRISANSLACLDIYCINPLIVLFSSSSSPPPSSSSSSSSTYPIIARLAMVLARLLRNSLSPALRTASPRFASSQLASLQIAVPRQHSSVIASSTSPPSRRTISTTRKNLDNNIMTDYSDGVGAWGAWQAEPSKFTQQVVDAMRTLYVDTSVIAIS